jgi:micrococcal nuclease
MTHHKFGLCNRLLLLSLILVLSISFPGCDKTGNSVLVTRVIDGDTIEIEGGYHVRYIGIDAPEKEEPLYGEATEANRNLVEGKKVYLEGDAEDKDDNGRLLRYVWLDNTMVNAELVRLGYAYSYSYPPNVKYQAYFLQLEREAREQELGLWSINH